LLYVLEMSKIEQNIAKQSLRETGKLPERILNAPSLKLTNQFYFQAFFELDSERINGFDIGPIPWSSIVKYAEYHGFEYDEREDFLVFIRRMDNVYIDFVLKKQKQNTG
jgi:hypothetical protein